ncbi:MAG: lipid-A-disaccharide synthase [Alphaproteobacteria bacterium]|nr:lipid-A-disaccharide synthase [Alphaproteobacteria bacterium]
MSRNRPLVYLVACEASGDELGARLIEALRAERNGEIDVVGVGGWAMVQAGLRTLFDPSELALIGVFEVLPKAGLVFRRVAETVDDVVAKSPDVLVTIDSWGFTGRIHQRLAKMAHATPRVRYVAPQVWAWRAGRARQLSRWIHHLMTLLPFEPPYFTEHGLPATWVGHPVIESGADRGEGARFRATYGIDRASTVLAVLPGSRTSEGSRLLPTFIDAVALVAKQVPNLVVAIPTVPQVAERVRAAAGNWPVRAIVIDDTAGKFDAFAASTAALAASGTVSLELALAGVPHVVGYRVNPLTAWVVRRLLKTKYVNLVNVLLDRAVIAERLQGECRPQILADDVVRLIQGADAMKADFRQALARLAPAGEIPSRVAARTVLSLLR